jgi:hypothetical protein
MKVPGPACPAEFVSIAHRPSLDGHRAFGKLTSKPKIPSLSVRRDRRLELVSKQWHCWFGALSREMTIGNGKAAERFGDLRFLTELQRENSFKQFEN